MFTLLRQTSLRSLLTTQAPALLLSFVVAEFLYKFKSFTLECVAFLATWFVIDAGLTWLASRFGARDSSETSVNR